MAEDREDRLKDIRNLLENLPQRLAAVLSVRPQGTPGQLPQQGQPEKPQQSQGQQGGGNWGKDFKDIFSSAGLPGQIIGGIGELIANLTRGREERPIQQPAPRAETGRTVTLVGPFPLPVRLVEGAPRLAGETGGATAQKALPALPLTTPLGDLSQIKKGIPVAQEIPTARPDLSTGQVPQPPPPVLPSIPLAPPPPPATTYPVLPALSRGPVAPLSPPTIPLVGTPVVGPSPPKQQTAFNLLPPVQSPSLTALGAGHPPPISQAESSGGGKGMEELAEQVEDNTEAVKELTKALERQKSGQEVGGRSAGVGGTVTRESGVRQQERPEQPERRESQARRRNERLAENAGA